MTRIAYQGVSGAYSEEAIQQYYGTEAEAVSCETFTDVFRAVETHECDYGMLPIENSVAGSVNRSYELLVEHDLRIFAEVILRVRHMLLAPKGTTPASLRVVRSHPQALAQCQNYLARHDLIPEAAADTAGSARNLAENPEDGVAVIAGAAAAELAGLEIIDRHIEDSQLNYTRFFVLSCEDAPRAQRNKTSLVFSTPHQPGALYDCLGEFASRRVSLSKIESRPRVNRPWQYMFYLDFEGHCRDPECEGAMMGLLRRSSFVKMLGSYPAATTPVDESQEPMEEAAGQEA
jgi:prephenate dehydratase